jgi:hypothetical protein
MPFLREPAILIHCEVEFLVIDARHQIERTSWTTKKRHKAGYNNYAPKEAQSIDPQNRRRRWAKLLTIYVLYIPVLKLLHQLPQLLLLALISQVLPLELRHPRP